MLSALNLSLRYRSSLCQAQCYGKSSPALHNSLREFWGMAVLRINGKEGRQGIELMKTIATYAVSPTTCSAFVLMNCLLISLQLTLYTSTTKLHEAASARLQTILISFFRLHLLVFKQIPPPGEVTLKPTAYILSSWFPSPIPFVVGGTERL